jgi:hypothetical protein
MFLPDIWTISCHFSLLQQIKNRSHFFLDAFTRHNYSRNRGKFPDLVFSNFTCLSIIHDVHLLVFRNTSHPTFTTDVQLRIRKKIGLLIFLSEILLW